MCKVDRGMKTKTDPALNAKLMKEMSKAQYSWRGETKQGNGRMAEDQKVTTGCISAQDN